MACRQIGKLNPTDGEKGIDTDEKRVGPLAREAFKGCRGFRRWCWPSRFDDLQRHGARGRFHVPHRGIGIARIGRINEDGHASGCGHQLAQELQPLCRQLLTLKKLMPVALPPGRARLATRPSLTGSSPAMKTIGIVVVAAFAASAAIVSDGGDHGDLPADQIGRQFRQPIDFDLLPSGNRSRRSGPRHSPSLSGPGETRAGDPRTRPAKRC